MVLQSSSVRSGGSVAVDAARLTEDGVAVGEGDEERRDEQCDFPISADF